MHMPKQTVEKLEKLSKLSESAQKKALGAALYEKAKPFLAQAKMKQGDEELKAAIPPWLLAMLIELGTELVKKLLEKFKAR